MNIVFWSECQGRCATSGNTLAVSVMASLLYSIKSVVMQFDYFSRPIDDVFEGKRQTNLIMEEYAYYNRKGIDTLLDKSQLKDICLDDMRANVLPIKNVDMCYIPASKRTKLGLTNKEIMSGARKIMELLNELADYNFIDCINGDRTVSKSILTQADVIVVNLCQGMNIDKLTLTDEMRKKAVYLVGRYDDGSKEDVRNICNKYNISRDKIAVIPYNIEFHDALHEGKLVQFIDKHMLARRTDQNFEFINGVFRATDMILRRAGFDDNI